MNYRFLGKTGVKVSALCFGTMSFGGDADEKTSADMFHLCRERGVNFFDCADIYGGGRSEEILGRLIRDHRQEVVIASKVYFASGPDVNAGGTNRKHVRAAVETSLKRLGTDYIDVYYLHRFDETVPLEESLRVLDDLVRQGKILYPAASNFAAWQVATALGLSARQGLARFECLQPMYNLVKRQAEVEIFPLARAESLGVFPYSPLGGGLLSGKYGPGLQPEEGRLVENKVYAKRYEAPSDHEIAGAFTRLAREHGFPPASLAVAWVASHPAVTAPIIGARNAAQLETCLKSVDIPMTPELRAAVSALSPEPPPATDRSEEGSPHTFGVRR
jgi:aryl-alcohol dehydrogenase-like predicted oxidoreductase